MFMPEAPPEAPLPPPALSELQNDEGGTVGTIHHEHYRLDDRILCSKEKEENFDTSPVENTLGGELPVTDEQTEGE